MKSEVKAKVIPVAKRKRDSQWTREHYRALKWIDENPSHEAEWLEAGGKPSWGRNPVFTHFRIRNRHSRIMIKKAIWSDLIPYVRSGAWRESQMFLPNTKGRRLRKKLQQMFCSDIPEKAYSETSLLLAGQGR